MPSIYTKLDESFDGFMNRSLVRFEFEKSPLHTTVYGGTGTGKTNFVRQYLKLYQQSRFADQGTCFTDQQSCFADQGQEAEQSWNKNRKMNKIINRIMNKNKSKWWKIVKHGRSPMTRGP